MNRVGEVLRKYALSEGDASKKNLFGRSAFNRYYYAAFLITREMLAAIDPRWEKTPHKNIPALLQDSLCKPVLHRLKLNAKQKLITDGESSRLRTKLTHATRNLADLMKRAYDVRRTADYEPESSIVVKDRDIILNSCTLTAANLWASRAGVLCKDIRKVWEDSGHV